MKRDFLLVLIVGLGAGACGRIGYEPISADAGGLAGGRGGAGGALAGSGGNGAGGSGAIGGNVSGIGGGGAGTSGTGGSGGGAGTTGVGGIGGGDGGISCASGTHAGHQYLFCDALIDWAAARAECESRGMRLARVDDQVENDWLLANANFGSMSRREGLWLGGYEPTTDGDWHWTDGDPFWLGAANGTAVGGLFTNWEKSEPNNAVGPEACLSMQLNGSVWYDYACSMPQYFACELY